MIALLRGTLLEKKADHIIIDVNGIGYQVFVSVHTLTELSGLYEDVHLHIHHHISDSAQLLYGFATPEEKHVFEQLITVRNIGPKIALGLLSGMRAGELHQTIASKDIKRLSTLPGIGKKTAERIALELQDVFSLDTVASPDTSSNAAGATPSPHDEAVQALENLGYKRQEAREAVAQIDQASGEQAVSSSDLLKQALQQLRKQ